MHVLVVVSDFDVRAVLRDALTAAGYRVSTAADSRTARAVVWWNTQPLVVLVQAPDLRALLAAVRGAPCAFIVLTTTPDDVPPPFNNPAMRRLMPVVPMPFRLDALLEAVAGATARLDGALEPQGRGAPR
jgi:DNA-binding NtrC family response regulator